MQPFYLRAEVNSQQQLDFFVVPSPLDSYKQNAVIDAIIRLSDALYRLPYYARPVYGTPGEEVPVVSGLVDIRYAVVENDKDKASRSWTGILEAVNNRFSSLTEAQLNQDAGGVPVRSIVSDVNTIYLPQLSAAIEAVWQII